MLTSVRNYVKDYPHKDYYESLIEKLGEYDPGKAGLGRRHRKDFTLIPGAIYWMRHLMDSSRNPAFGQ